MIMSAYQVFVLKKENLPNLPSLPRTPNASALYLWVAALFLAGKVDSIHSAVGSTASERLCF